MKKFLFTIMLFGMLSVLPIRSMAMLKIDENGNPITEEVKTGETTTMMATDGVAPDQSVTTGPNQSVSSDDEVIYQTYTAEDDVMYQTKSGEEIYETTSGDEMLTTTSAKEDSNNVLVIVTLASSLVAMALALTAIFLVQKRK